jgi:HlyD family secretion protein
MSETPNETPSETPSETLAEAPAGSGRRRLWIGIAAAVALLALAGWVAGRRGPDLQYLVAPVKRSDVREVVEATGTVDAVVTVQVGSQVSGTIARLHADFNSRVRQGDVVAEIDPQLFEGALLAANADLENARANVVAAEANLAKAKAAREQTRAEFDRAQALTDVEVGSRQALDLAQANFRSAKAAVDAAAANVVQAKAEVAQKRAAVSVAKTNLRYTVIRSPIDGTVVARNVDVGQTVAASLQAPTIFTIAQDLTKMRVYAKIDESDVGRVRAGQAVTFKVDAFPKDRFSGRVSQVRMKPTMVQNVVTYDAVVELENPELKLFPGMTAYVSIPVAEAHDAVALPNAALHFRPPLEPEEIRALYAAHGITDESGSAETSGEASGGEDGRSAPERKRETAVVWKLRGDGAIEPVELALGITDHTVTAVEAVVAGHLAAGDEVVTSAVRSKTALPGARSVRR